MHARHLILLALLPLTTLAVMVTGQEPVSRELQPAFVPPLEGPPGIYYGEQKPWRLPREKPRRPRAVNAAWRGTPLREALGLGVAPVEAPLPTSHAAPVMPFMGSAQEPVEAVGGGAQEPEPASARVDGERQPATLLDAIRDAPDAPSALEAMRFGVSLDLYVMSTEAEELYGEANALRLRTARLDLEADVDRSTALRLSADFGDTADDAVLLREASVLVGGLPGARGLDGWWLRAGRFYADLGAFNTALPGGYVAPRPGAAAEDFLGGNLLLTGVAVHQDHAWSAGHLRWSAALASEVERHPWKRAQGDQLDPAPTGRTGADNITATARLAAQFDASRSLSWRVGASGLYTPSEVAFQDDGLGNTQRLEGRHALWGLDAGLLLRGDDPARSHELAAEVWLDDAELDPAGDAELGYLLFYRLCLDAHWSAGLQYSVAEHALTGPGMQRSAEEAWLGYAFHPGNRLSIFFSHENPGDRLEKYFTLGAEWTLELGPTFSEGIPRWRETPLSAASPTAPTARR